MQTRLFANDDELVFTTHLPPLLASFTWEGTAPIVASGNFGHVLLQEKSCNGIAIRVWHYLLNGPGHFTAREEKPVLRLQFQLTNHLQYEPDGMQHLTFYEHGYNLFYIPNEQSNTHFPAEGIYSYLEIYYPENILLKLQPAFSAMHHFLKRVERKQNALLMPVNQVGSRALLEIVERLVISLSKTTDKSWLRTRAVEALAQCLDDCSQYPMLEPVTIPLQEAGKIYYARRMMQELYAQPWSMKELSKKTGLNFYKLQHGFRQLYRQSPMDYLKDLRMEKAWQLLPGGNYSVAQVAEMTGYTNLSAFSKAFRKYFHITPRERSKES